MSLLSVETRRKPGIDAIRGIAQLFVIFGHLNFEGPLGVFIGPIKIPLFFAITGYLFRVRKQKDFYKNLVIHLVLPWLALAMVEYLVGGILRRNPMYILEGFLKVVRGKDTWFMPCAIVAQIIHLYIRKFGRNTWVIAGSCVVCFAAGLTLGHFGILDDMMINRALVAQLFLLIGYLFQSWNGKGALTGWRMAIAAGGVFAALGVVSLLVYPGGVLDVHRNYYYNLPICVALIFTGCLAMLAVGHNVKWAPKILCFFGQNTLIFYIWEAYPRAALNKAMALVGITLPAPWHKLALLAATLVGCTVAALVLNKFLPELVGKKRKKK